MLYQLYYSVSVTWNGSTITGPVLIYLNEILVDSYDTVDIGDPNRPGVLICRSEDRARVGWHFTDGVTVPAAPTVSSESFKQIRTGEEVIPSLSRLSLNSEGINQADTRTNGLWHCRLNDNGTSSYDAQISVGIFSGCKYSL